MAKFLFQLVSLQEIVSRDSSEGGDQNVVTFGVMIGDRQIGPVLGGGGAPSGQTFTWSDPRYLGNPPWFRSYAPTGYMNCYGRMEVGPLDVQPGDVVNIAYGLVNTAGGYSPNSDPQKIGFATWGALVGIAGAATGGVAAIISAVFAAIGALLSFLPGWGGSPNCNGVVGADKIAMSGSELLTQTSNPNNSFSYPDSSGNADTPDGCNQSKIVMTISVTRMDSYSLRWFVANGFRWLRGNTNFRNITKAALPHFYSGPTTSVRNLIENWQTTFPSSPGL